MKPSEVEQKHFEIRASNEEIFKGHLVLINYQNPIRRPVHTNQLASLDILPSIKQLSEGMLLEKYCLDRFHSLLEACGGIDKIIAVSAYRTKEDQSQIYKDSLIERGSEYTSKYVALPDHSEHQTGLAIDVGRLKSKIAFISPSFPDTGIFRSFRRHAAQYGFILRYKQEKESITRISHEPWHFRYVGYPHSRIMEENNLCLEEYIDFVELYRYSGEQLTIKEENMTTNIYYVPADKETYTNIPIIKCDSYSVSGTNREGFIVTVISKNPEI
ncbi:D-alanyl-D-alanine carboxypeptidase family protein [Paenibacillus apii]|uniref:D-alanyl-D-alanine carboxypeptidase family protein n=1 Tax=Paenibacillus apii TaxID=1850370 RepID=UPI00143AEBDE|nr:D-alanyl-D-alanine carboxypeptidase family protein [Paenibacillus apii]NJJ40427.1 M15 family metallopeptidase [Paenibacillus apii]